MTQTVLLRDIADVLNGAAFSSRDFIAKEQATVGDLPVFKMGNLSIGGGIRKGKDDYIPASKLEKTQNQVTRPYDILMCMTDMKSSMNLLGYSGQIKNEVFAVNQRVGIIRPKEDLVNPTFLYYYLNSPDFIDRIRATANSGVQVNLSTSAIRNIEIELPTTDKQVYVSDMMGSIDEKIELNRRMNETLEQMGQALFRHYFIDNHEVEKWDRRELGEFFPVKTGKKDANFGTEDGKYPFFTCAQTVSKAPDFSFDAHALLLAGNGDFNLKLHRGKFEAYQRTYVLVPDDERLVGLLYFLMKMKLPEITGGSRGSVIKFITKGMIENYKFALPEDGELVEMAGIFNQLTVSIEENIKQIQTLTTLRDTLLPRLINGKVKL